MNASRRLQSCDGADAFAWKVISSWLPDSCIVSGQVASRGIRQPLTPVHDSTTQDWRPEIPYSEICARFMPYHAITPNTAMYTAATATAWSRTVEREEV